MIFNSAQVLARNVKRIKERKGITSIQLAALASTTPAVITSIEKGEGNPTLKRIDKLAEALNTSPSDLLSK